MAIYSDMENEGHHIISAYLLIATLDPVESRKSEYAESCLASPDVQPSIHWQSYLEPADLSRHSHEFNKRRNLYYKVCTLQPYASQGWLERSKLEEECGKREGCS